MRRTLTSLFVLGLYFLNFAQSPTDVVKALAISDPENISELEFRSDAGHNDPIGIVSSSLSEGFTDSSFQSLLHLSISDDQQLTMETDYQHTLQYTISNVEGIILKKGKFYGSEAIDLARYRDGSYAIYFFAGKRIVRALMLEQKRVAM